LILRKDFRRKKVERIRSEIKKVIELFVLFLVIIMCFSWIDFVLYVMLTCKHGKPEGVKYVFIPFVGSFIWYYKIKELNEKLRVDR